MKATIIVNKELPIGLVANCAAVLGLSLGALKPDLVGPDAHDASGHLHRGITGLPLPVLGSSAAGIRDLVGRSQEDSQLTVVPFNRVAQGCTSYDDYLAKMALAPADSLEYLGVLLLGPPKSVARLTGNLPLLR